MAKITTELYASKVFKRYRSSEIYANRAVFSSKAHAFVSGTSENKLSLCPHRCCG